jgi:cysteine desulfurase
MTESILYLDHAATTPLRPAARSAMAPFLESSFGNPSSAHAAGREARGALEEARARVAGALGAEPSEIVFTAGGTESDNLAVLGRWRAAGAAARGVAVSAIEHSAVRAAAGQAAREGAALTTVGVDEGAVLDRGALEEALEEPHAVVSVMWANNEVGTVQPVRWAADRAHAAGASFHTDAVQAVGHVPVDVGEAGCDLLSLSAHKFGGPRGIGALYVRAGTELEPVIHGGSQERGLRPGTSNVAGAVGLAAALDASIAEMARESARLRDLRDALEAALLDRVPGARRNGEGERLPHVLSVRFPDVAADILVPALDMSGLAVSSGSACHSGASAPSHVLVAMGAGDDAVVRFSLGWTTTAEEVERAAEIVMEVVDRSRAVTA